MQHVSVGEVLLGITLLYLIGSGLLREFGRIVFAVRKLEARIRNARSKAGEV